MTDEPKGAAGEEAGARGWVARFLSSLKGALPLLLGLVGFVVAFYVLRWDAFKGDAAKRFAGTAQYRLWALLLYTQTALWFALALPLAASLFRKGERPKKYDISWDVALKAAAVFGFLLWMYFSNGFDAPVEDLKESLNPHHDIKLAFFSLGGLGVSLLAMAGIWAAQGALKGLGDESRAAKEKGATAATTAERVGRAERFLALRSRVELYLLAAGTIIGAATLATGALRQAVVAYSPRYEHQFMVQDVLGYGLGFSFLLALVYAPAYARLAQTRALLLDELAPLSGQGAGGQKPWDEWNKERKAAGEMLHANAGFFASMTGAVSILTPLLGSLVALLLGKG